METIEQLISRLELVKQEKNSFEAWRNELINAIDYLINSNFSQLVFILYKLDISESKIELSLKNTDTQSASILADLIIERSLVKLETRKNFHNDTTNVPDDELL